MTLQLISTDSFPTYIALSSDITTGSTISGASQIGKTVYITDTESWYVVTGSNLILNRFYMPVQAGLGTMAYQSASSVLITGGSIVAENARFGNSESSSYFESDGTLIFSGSATVWDDIFFPLVTAKQGQTDKPAFSPTEVAYLFPQDDTTEFMYIVGQLPHSMKVGSDLSPHVHWKQTQSGSPIFKMDYKWFPIGGSVPASWESHVMSTPAVPYTSGSVQQLSCGNRISGSALQSVSVGVSSIMLIKLYRDTGDDYNANAVVYQFDIHFEKDSLGSHSEFIK